MDDPMHRGRIRYLSAVNVEFIVEYGENGVSVQPKDHNHPREGSSSCRNDQGCLLSDNVFSTPGGRGDSSDSSTARYILQRPSAK